MRVSLGQALALAQLATPAWPAAGGAGGEGGGVAATKLQRVYVCTARDTLRRGPIAPAGGPREPLRQG
jgi:hypothetical protein